MDDPGAHPSPEASAPIPASLEPASQNAPKPWSLLDLVFFIAFAFLAVPMAYLAALGGYFVMKSVTGLRTPLSVLGENPFFLLGLQCAFYGLLLGYIYFLIVVNYRQPFWTALRWHKPTAQQTTRFFLGGIVLALAVQLAPSLLPEKEGFPLERLFTSPAAAYAIGAFAILVAPLVEELIFRGVLFSIFERQGGLAFAVVSTAVLFAGLHVPEYWGAWNHALMILVVGLVFSFARGMTGSLAPSVILHLSYNASQMTALFFVTHHFRILHAVFLG